MTKQAEDVEEALEALNWINGNICAELDTGEKEEAYYSRLETIRSEITRLREKLEEVEEERDTYKSLRDSLTGRYKEAKKERDEARRQLSECSDECARLRQALCDAACTCSPPDPDPSVHAEYCDYRARLDDALDHGSEGEEGRSMDLEHARTNEVADESVTMGAPSPMPLGYMVMSSVPDDCRGCTWETLSGTGQVDRWILKERDPDCPVHEADADEGEEPASFSELQAESLRSAPLDASDDPPDEGEEEQKSDLDPCANCGAYRNGHPWEDAACDEFVEPARCGACGRVRRPVRPADDQPGEDGTQTEPEGGEADGPTRQRRTLSDRETGDPQDGSDDTDAGEQEVTAPGEDGVGEIVDVLEEAQVALEGCKCPDPDGGKPHAQTEHARERVNDLLRRLTDRPAPDDSGDDVGCPDCGSTGALFHSDGRATELYHYPGCPRRGER